MLLKYTKTSGSGSSFLTSTPVLMTRGTGMRMTMSSAVTMSPRIHRKSFRTPSKRHPGKTLPGKLHVISRNGPGKLMSGKRIPQRPHVPPCDNSNDSGFGFDQHVELQQHQMQQSVQQNQYNTLSSNFSRNNYQLQNQHENYHNHQQQHQNSGQQYQHKAEIVTNVSTISDSNSAVNNFPITAPVMVAAPALSSQHLLRASRLSETESMCLENQIHDAEGNQKSDQFISMSQTKLQPHIQLTPSNSPISHDCSLKFDCHTFLQKNVSKYSHMQSMFEMDNEDACSEETFKQKMCAGVYKVMEIGEQNRKLKSGKLSPTTIKFVPGNRNLNRVAHKRQPSTPINSVACSANGNIQLEIVLQPEQQHRARYQTEGSRGAVKDRSGNSFPVVRLVGYNKATVLQVFIGTDVGRIAPHMFYQACKVAGKNSTQCHEKKVDGTMVIEIDIKPETDMTITCDCVGILKERNVDVEHRFPDHLTQKSKKKSTRCRMVFRTQIAHDDGSVETLQVCSYPIICTQPPGVPEISKKSLSSCPADGGLELFIIGKNFLKDTQLIFRELLEDGISSGNDTDISLHQQIVSSLWEQTVLPDKEYLQQTHLICTVPPFVNQNILKPVTVHVSVVSSGKQSEPHQFFYTPKGSYTVLSADTTLNSGLHTNLSRAQDQTYMDTSSAGTALVATSTNTNTDANLWPVIAEAKLETETEMMPPPISTQMPVGVRRSSLSSSANASLEVLKTEFLDESSQNSLADSLRTSESVGNGCEQNPTTIAFGPNHYTNASNFSSDPRQISATRLGVNVKVVDASTVTSVVVNNHSPIFDVTNAVDRTFNNIFQQAGVTNNSQQQTNNIIDHNSENSPTVTSTSSSGISNNSTSTNNSLNAHCSSSPIIQDIILNSEPAASLNALLPTHPSVAAQNAATTVNELSQLSNVDANGTSATTDLTTDIIMNPSVTPSSLLCSTNNTSTIVTNIIAPHEVSMAGSMLNDFSMQPRSSEDNVTVSNLTMNNIIIDSPSTASLNVSAVSSTSTIVSSDVTNTTPTVSNLMIDTTADFIMTGAPDSQSEEHQIQSQQQEQKLITSSNVENISSSDSLVRMLLSHQDLQSQSVQQASNSIPGGKMPTTVDTITSNFPIVMTTDVQQESLIVAALATERALQKSVVANANVNTNSTSMEMNASTSTASNVHTDAANDAVLSQTAVPLPQSSIPQELTIMSDQDLISYINPNAFDQI